MNRKNFPGFLIFILLIAIFPLIAQQSPVINHYIDVMIFGGIFGIVAIGLSLLMGYAGQISLAQAAFMGLGAYSSGILTTHFNLSPPLAILLGIGITSAIAFAIGVPSLRLKGHYLAMATLGFGVIVHIVFNEEVNWTGGPSGLVGIPGLSLGPWALKSALQWYYFTWFWVAIFVLFALNLVDSRIGRALRAIHEDDRAAEAMGVPTARYKLQIFVISAAMAAFAGSLYAHYVEFINPSSFDLVWSIKFILMVMVGGIQSIWGSLLGSLFLTFLSNEWLQVFAELEILIYGLILLVISLFFPDGLFPLIGARFNMASLFGRAQGGNEINFQREHNSSKGVNLQITIGEKREPQPNTFILKVKELGKSFGGVEALHNVTLSVPSGIIQAIIGPNGAGKTTLLNCISGVIKPSKGQISFYGKPIDNLPSHKIAALGISRTFQNVALFKRMTVIENVAIGRHTKTRSGFTACSLRLPFMTREERVIFEKTRDWLEFVGLVDEIYKEAGSLPLGKQKLLEVARALATEPRLLLLDEPAGGLNTAETEQFGELIEKIKNLGITVLIIEHDMNLVMERSDQVAVLHYGKLLATGTPDEIKKNPQVVEVYLGKEE